MIVKTEDGRCVEFGAWQTYTISKEDRKELNRVQNERHRQKLVEERKERSVPENEYHIQTIKKKYKELGYALKPVFGGYKGGRFQPRQKYDVIENFGDHRVIVENQNYYQLGEILRRIGVWNNDTNTE